MPRIIDLQSDETCSLGDCVEGVAQTGFDPNCDESVAQNALWLRKLNNNRTFLGDLLLDRLKHQFRNMSSDNGYGPQAIVLSPLRGDVFLRANIWPSEQDHCYQASGAKSFVYGVPHDHNFSFLTSGYLGPGYRSDYYEYDYAAVAGYRGERPGLRFIERAALEQGKLMLYRAHQDVHSQIPAQSLSVSLNIMHIDPMQSWYDQYGFDTDSGEVSRVLSPNATEVFMRLAVATGHQNAWDLAADFGQHHPCDRMRLASFEARALLLEDSAARDDLWRQAELSGSQMVRMEATRHRQELAFV